MDSPELTLLADFRHEDGVPRFADRRWNAQEGSFQWRPVAITEDELERQLTEPVRISDEPRFWLFRGRVVLEEGASSYPDDFVDALTDERAHMDARVEQEPAQFPCGWSYVVFAPAVAKRLGRPLWFESQQGMETVYRDAKRGVLPKRHTDLICQRSEELMLQIKHLVFSEERSIERLKREVDLFEKADAMPPSSRRERIPDDVRMFVWRRDQGRCARCGSRENIEFDHVVPVSEGGGNTARNIELLCERCNRAKGASIVAGLPLSSATAVRRRILVVHVDPGMRDLLARTLELAEYEVETADSGSAIDRLGTTAFDVLICGVETSDGFNVVGEAKRLRSTLPVVAISQPNHEVMDNLVKALGVSTNIKIPLTVAAVLTAVAAALSR